jgi:RNA polymerase sigma-70 factor (ECF subfamily)
MNNKNNNEDFYLIDKVNERNKDAFKVLMIKYQPRVYSALLGYVKSKEDAEDLTQQVFVRVWDKIDSFRGDSAFFTWVYRIAINIAKNHVTSATFKKDKLNISDDVINFDYPHFSSPELSIESSETSLTIKNFISTLPEILKTPFILREYEGKSYEEIANIIDCPLGTVRSRIFRAREATLSFIKEELTND